MLALHGKNYQGDVTSIIILAGKILIDWILNTKI